MLILLQLPNRLIFLVGDVDVLGGGVHGWLVAAKLHAACERVALLLGVRPVVDAAAGDACPASLGAVSRRDDVQLVVLADVQQVARAVQGLQMQAEGAKR